MSAYEDVCPADSALWTLRDVQSTVPSQEDRAFLRLYRALIADPYNGDVVRDEAIEWASDQKSYVFPLLVVSVIALLAWLPLWISRCCAHRCCSPSADGPSEAWKKRCTGAFYATYVVMFACSVVGILAFIDLLRGFNQTACSAHDGLRYAEAEAVVANRTLALYLEALHGVNGRLAEFQNGSACLELTELDRADFCSFAYDIQSDVQRMGEMIGAENLTPAFFDLQGYVNQAATMCQVIVDDFPLTLTQLLQVISELQQLISTLTPYLEDIQYAVQYVGENLHDGAEDIIIFYTDVNPTVEVICIICACLLFFSPVLLNTAAAMLLWAVIRRKEVSHASWESRLNVQLLGTSWVFCTICCFFYFFVSVILLLGGHTGYQLGNVLYVSIAKFASVYNNSVICGEIPTALPTPSVIDSREEVCFLGEEYLQACAVGANGMDAVILTLGSPLTLSEALDQLLILRNTTLSIDFTPISEALIELNTSLLAATNLTESLTVDDMGADPTGSADYEVISRLYANITDQLLPAVERVELVAPCVEHVIALSEDVVSYTLEITNLSIITLEVLYRFGECENLRLHWIQVSNDFYDVADAPVILAAVGLIVVGAAMLFYVPGAISMQMIYGGVGSEPGCPPSCRCWCKDRKTQSLATQHAGSRTGGVPGSASVAMDEERVALSSASMSGSANHSQPCASRPASAARGIRSQASHHETNPVYPSAEGANQVSATAEAFEVHL